MTRLRGAYFAEAAATATRFGIAFEDVVQHLWAVRRRRRLPLDLRSIDHVDDLVLAVACLRRVGGAWTDLVDRYEPVLVRRCAARLGETRSILLVRRMFLGLRDTGAGGEGLDAYAGERSLRAWLTDRVLSEAGRSRKGRSTTHAEVRTKGGARLRRCRDGAMAERWWGDVDAPASLRFTGWDGQERETLPPPAAGASE
ncbi:MAG: hypothetical protein ACYTJ0_00340 [Planctomycetota bacterium]|jgi:hypothetical protein